MDKRVDPLLNCLNLSCRVKRNLRYDCGPDCYLKKLLPGTAPRYASECITKKADDGKLQEALVIIEARDETIRQQEETIKTLQLVVEKLKAEHPHKKPGRPRKA